jgi:hypothetical protein
MGDSASNMSALEVAAMGKFLHAQKMSMEQDESASAVQLEMDAKDRDWQPLIEEAKGTWQGVGSLFAKKVDFTLHGTHFLGKAGYSVKAGVVPLFDGAALDLKFAKLEATKTQDVPPGFENWVEAKGSGGMLVLAPVGMDNVVPISMEDVVVTEQGLSGSAKKHMEFRAGQHRLTAESLSLSTEAAQLFGVTETEDAQSEPVKRQSAKITGQGITVTKAAEPQGKQEEQKKQEEQGSGEQDREEKKTGDAGAIRHVSEPEPTPEPKPDPQPKPKPDEQTDQNETPEKKEEEK